MRDFDRSCNIFDIIATFVPYKLTDLGSFVLVFDARDAKYDSSEDGKAMILDTLL